MADFIPDADSAFDDFARAFMAALVANGAGLGIAAGTITALDTYFNGDWTDALVAHIAARDAAAAAAADKDVKKATLIGMIRPVAAQVQANPAMTDVLRVAFHLPIRDTTRTAAPVPTTRPLVTVDASQRLQHTIHWRDESTPNSKAKPRGVQGAEIRYSIGPTPPSDPESCTFAALDSATPYLLEHNPADGGKLIHYLVRWVNTRGQAGPWSETVSVTIGA